MITSITQIVHFSHRVSYYILNKHSKQSTDYLYQPGLLQRNTIQKYLGVTVRLVKYIHDLLFYLLFVLLCEPLLTLCMLYMCVDAEYPQKVVLGRDFIKSILGDYEVINDIDGMELDIPKTNGMKVLRNVVELEKGGTGNVIVRNNTENFWLKVIEATETETDRVCALGTPGIGKTTTTCILIRLLLKKNKTVVYRVRRKNTAGIIYMFTRSRVESEVVVNVI